MKTELTTQVGVAHECVLRNKSCGPHCAQIPKSLPPSLRRSGHTPYLAWPYNFGPFPTGHPIAQRVLLPLLSLPYLVILPGVRPFLKWLSLAFLSHTSLFLIVFLLSTRYL